MFFYICIWKQVCLKVTLCAFVVINAEDDEVLLMLDSSCNLLLSGQLNAKPL